MIHHFTHQDSAGAWHTVYRIPNCEMLSSVMVASTQAAASKEAARQNLEQARMAAYFAASQIHPADRKIPSGFYSDKDAE